MDLKTVRTVVVEGDVVEVRREVVEKRISVTEFIDQLTSEAPIITPPLPSRCVMYAQSVVDGAARTVFVVERRAGVHPFLYRHTSTEPRLAALAMAAAEVREGEAINARNQRVREVLQVTHQLSMPYLYLAVAFRADGLNGVYPFATQAPLMAYGTRTRIYRAPLPNIYPNGTMCLGSTLELDADRPMTKRVDTVTKFVFEDSQWNEDLSPVWEDLGIANGIYGWEDASKENVQFWTSIRMKNFVLGDKHKGKTIGTLATASQLINLLLGKEIGETPSTEELERDVYPVVQQ